MPVVEGVKGAEKVADNTPDTIDSQKIIKENSGKTGSGVQITDSVNKTEVKDIVEKTEAKKNIDGEGEDRVTESVTKTYQTYIKTNPTTGEVYSGRTSGTGTPAENVRQRDSHHHMNDKGFGPAVLDKSSTNYDAIRGREQMLIDFYGGAKSTGGNSGNAINGIGNKNRKKDTYLNVAEGEFGKIE